MNDNANYGTGRRKTAAARVFLSPGSGRITVNRRPLDTYFRRDTARMAIRRTLEAIGMAYRFDIEWPGNGLRSNGLRSSAETG